MAKKTVATLQKGGKAYTKVIKPVKSQTSGAYTFVEEMVLNDKVQEFLSK